MQKYNPQKIEKKWQKEWEENKLYETQDEVKGKDNFFLLTEFPYPSGNLHVGHWYAYALPDIKARYLRMRGFNVLYPIGFDAFGLPAENAAIKHNLKPKDWTEKNIGTMTKQLKTMGATFDWSRCVVTIDPAYYRWTQWMFLQFYKKGLVYRAKTKVNWCPDDKTVLANEQVIAGKCFRCGSNVLQKELSQWMLKITDYADRLIDDLHNVNYAPNIKLAQENWIGRSIGAEVDFLFKGSNEKLTVFTTRVDTIFGVTHLVLAPEHDLLKKLASRIKNIKEVKNYIEQASNKTELMRREAKEKTGVKIEGITAINPVNNGELSVWIADYVFRDYGTGAIMAVPGHDERDFEFAQKYNIPIREVVVPNIVDRRNPPVDGKAIVARENVHAIVLDPKTYTYLALKWKKFDWVTFPAGGVGEGEDIVDAARREVEEETGFVNLKLVRVLPGKVRAEYFAAHKDQNRVSYTQAVVFELIDHEQKAITQKEKDDHDIIWLERSKLNYANMTHAEVGNWEEQITTSSYVYTEEGVLINSSQFNGMESKEAKIALMKELGKKGVAKEKINYKLHDWILSRQRYWGTPIPMIHCEKCEYQPVSEDRLPVVLPKLEDYKPSDDGRSPLAKARQWLQVKCPNCNGNAERETDTMDTFVDSSWYFLRYTDYENKEVFAGKKKMAYWLPVDEYVGGAEHTTMHLLYSRFWNKALHDLGLVEFKEPYVLRRNRGLILGPDGQKMSKSRGNVIDPDEQVKKYGSDTVRMYLAFLGPFDQGGPWDPKGINGIYRFLNRVWRQAHGDFGSENDSVAISFNKAVKKIAEDIEDLKFNTAISELMKLLNDMDSKSVSKQQFSGFIKMLSPFAPHLAEEIWQEILENNNSIHGTVWPAHNPDAPVERKTILPVQINGKVRVIIEINSLASEEEVKSTALENEAVKKYVNSGEIKKIFYIKGKVINIVTF